jgi:hypothetical protein
MDLCLKHRNFATIEIKTVIHITAKDDFYHPFPLYLPLPSSLLKHTLFFQATLL